MSMQKGFTLIELVIVIVILGILAAVAVPQFVDITPEAEQAAVDGVAGALSSGAAINYGVRKANPAKGQAVAQCSDAANTLQGGLPAGYSINPAATPVPADTTVTCTVQDATATYTANFSAIGVL